MNDLNGGFMRIFSFSKLLILLLLASCNSAQIKKQVCCSQDAPKAIGPYSQAIKAGNFLFMSGQIGIEPGINEITGRTISEQTEQVILNMKAVLKSAGTDISNVVKTTVFLKNISDFKEMNSIYEKHFSVNPPARSTVEVSKLPKDALVEIESIAVIPDR